MFYSENHKARKYTFKLSLTFYCIFCFCLFSCLHFMECGNAINRKWWYHAINGQTIKLLLLMLLHFACCQHYIKRLIGSPCNQLSTGKLLHAHHRHHHQRHHKYEFGWICTHKRTHTPNKWLQKGFTKKHRRIVCWRCILVQETSFVDMEKSSHCEA